MKVSYAIMSFTIITALISTSNYYQLATLIGGQDKKCSAVSMPVDEVKVEPILNKENPKVWIQAKRVRFY